MTPGITQAALNLGTAVALRAAEPRARGDERAWKPRSSDLELPL